jgi:hypothetical protein
VQKELLEARPRSSLQVYAVWYNMFPGDSRGLWRPDLLTDSRVVHYWDESQSVGRLYFQGLPQIWAKRAADTVLPQDVILWDAYLLYARDARWEQQPPDVVSWGSTILLSRDRLKQDLEAILER